MECTRQCLASKARSDLDGFRVMGGEVPPSLRASVEESRISVNLKSPRRAAAGDSFEYPPPAVDPEGFSQ